MSIVLSTGAAIGIGNLTARASAGDGYTVVASMRNVAGRNAVRVHELVDLGHRYGVDVRVLEPDVQSQDSVDQAVRTIIDAAGRIDAGVHNAGHLYIGYVEAFTTEGLARVLDINAVGVHWVNRGVLPHKRERRSGTLVYVGGTTTVEWSARARRTRIWRRRTGPEAGATGRGRPPLRQWRDRLPIENKPFRSVVDFTGAHVAELNAVACAEQKDCITRLGFAEPLQLKD